MWHYNNTDELYHYGILGMRWGIRRFQDRNGKLTPRGKKRRLSKDAYEVKKLQKHKRLDQMSNDELRKINNRKELESKYKSHNKGYVATGAAIVAATATVLGNYANIRKNVPRLINDGKWVLKKMGIKK